MISHYSLLKISPTASQHEIQLAFSNFKEEIIKYGPGLEINDEDLKIQFPEICEAYFVLMDPVKRKEYDAVIEVKTFVKEETPEEPESEIPETLSGRITRIFRYLIVGLFIFGILYLLSHFFSI